jgi:hypothetical protein
MIVEHDTVAITDTPRGELPRLVRDECVEWYAQGFDLIGMTTTRPARTVERGGYSGDDHYDADLLLVFRKVSG